MMAFARQGFTLMELIVVITIIGVLAAIAFPMMTANLRGAKMTEAKAAIGAIRTAERMYLADKATYLAVTAAQLAGDTSALNAYIKGSDLAGQYFSAYDYRVTGASATAFNIVCGGNSASSTAPKKAEVNGYVLNMDAAGNINNN